MFKKIKGFSKYEVNHETKQVRNTEGKILSIKTGTGRYQLYDDAGKRKLIAIDDLHSESEPKHLQTWRLHLEGKSPKEIQALLNVPLPSIHRDIWKYKSGRLKLPA